jgi:predicted transcriptional regulator YdeE
MEPQVIKIAAFNIIGLRMRRDYSEKSNEGALWDALMKRLGSLKVLGPDSAFYGVNVILSEEETRSDVFDYFAGIQMTEPESALPDDISLLRIPELLYAEFSFRFENMVEEINLASKVWLPKSAYRRDELAPIYDFLRFPAKTTGESAVIYAIPVRPKGVG